MAQKYEMNYKEYVYGLNASKPQFLHTMLCVRDLEASRHFYVDGIGMKLLDRMDIDFKPRVSALFIGFDAKEPALELAHYWDDDGPYAPYAQKRVFGHVAIGVPDLNAIVAKLEAMGIEIAKPPAVALPGAPPAAFLNDPDGYEVELIQTRNP